MFENKDYIYEVYKQKSFSKAAKVLYINQSSLSLTIQKAERQLGLQIFNRKTKPITLTDFGKRYIEAIEAVDSLGREMQEYIDNTKQEVNGSLTIGAAAFCVAYILPDLISEFISQYPHVLINLVEAPTLDLKQELQKNNIDLMVSSDNIQLDHFESHPLYGETMVLIVPDKWVKEEDEVNLAYFSPLTVFRHVPFIMLRKGNNNRQKVEELMQKQNIKIRPILETDQNISACSMACAGIGASIVSDRIASKLCGGKKVHIYPLSDPEMKRINYISCPKPSGFLVHEFIRVAQHSFFRSGA